MFTRLWLIAILILFICWGALAQPLEGSYRLSLETKRGQLTYDLQLVQGTDSLVYGGVKALPDSITYQRPLRLERLTADSLYLSIWGKTCIKVSRQQSTVVSIRCSLCP